MWRTTKSPRRTVKNVSKHRKIPHRFVLACGGIVRWKQMGYNETRIMIHAWRVYHTSASLEF
jgi:hypothetical protein